MYQNDGYDQLAETVIAMMPSTTTTLDHCLHFFFPKIIFRAGQTPPDDRHDIFSYNNIDVWLVALSMRNTGFADPGIIRTLLQGIEDDEGVDQDPSWQECLSTQPRITFEQQAVDSDHSQYQKLEQDFDQQ
ncbi:hypothetical protein QFC22_004387 [Naganishia vaughanmartiniae]|uniref:Uncharacterized protein n=1 Tax=Naganishia vaughanmartiniae TaxID=1424756 RepID=A0ACC2X2M3_9TREE|nr:hypothetical protein QFC22_004387 [Naganishia vaughanmartiniae]